MIHILFTDVAGQKLTAFVGNHWIELYYKLTWTKQNIEDEENF